MKLFCDKSVELALALVRYGSVFAVAALTACGGGGGGPSGSLLSLVADVGLPGGSTRFDYQEIDPAKGQLVVAHMGMPEYGEFLELAAAYPGVRLDTTMTFTDFTEGLAPFPAGAAVDAVRVVPLLLWSGGGRGAT